MVNWLRNILDSLPDATKNIPEPHRTWKIDKTFDFCYGHRVWSQKLIGDFCETGDTHCKCRHLHGHQGHVKVFLEADELERGMVTDFKHLGWLKNFLDDYVDHKFIMDINDPWFTQITNLLPAGHAHDNTTRHYHAAQTLNTSDDNVLVATAVFVPGTGIIAGWNLDLAADRLQGPEREFFESFFFVDFLPTSENLSRWLYECVKEKMDKINVKVTQVDWNETPKSRSSYREV